MAVTGTFVSLSRNQLGPDPEAPAHGIRYVERDGNGWRATCFCGWRSGRRKFAEIARESLGAHMIESGVIDAGIGAE